MPIMQRRITPTPTVTAQAAPTPVAQPAPVAYQPAPVAYQPAPQVAAAPRMAAPSTQPGGGYRPPAAPVAQPAPAAYQPTVPQVAAASNQYEAAVNRLNPADVPASYQDVYNPALGSVTGNTLQQSVAAQPTAPLATIRATPQSVLQAFFQLPEFQLLFGSDPTVNNPNASPTQRFQADPGYQYQQDEAAKQIQRNASARGLLNSGPVLKELTNYSQNLANQSYNQWLDRTSRTYTGYQDRLLQLMGFGSGFNGSANAVNQGNTLAGLTTGTGNNISSLQQGLGQNIMNSNLQTGANTANALTQLSSTQAQTNAQRDIGAAQAAAQVAQANAQIQSSAMGAGASIFSSLAGAFF